MAIGLVGQKCGMTRIFTDAGDAIPVTVIHVEPNHITQVKTAENDGYSAIQVTTGKKKPSRVTKAAAGHFAKAKVEPGEGLWEFLIPEGSDLGEFELGKEICVDVFSEGQMVDVTGTSKGKGFAGTIKRHNFSSQRATHGNSLAHRAPGSIGQNQSPRKVFKGKKMSGQMGNKQCTVQNQAVVRIDKERNMILVRGAVPGAPGSKVIIKPAVKISSAEEAK